MGTTSSPDLTITRFEFGMPRLLPQSGLPSMGRPILYRSLLTLRTDSTSFLGLMTTLLVCGTHFHLLPSGLPLVARSILNFSRSPTWTVGSGTQRVVYCTGSPMSVAQVCIHLPL